MVLDSPDRANLIAHTVVVVTAIISVTVLAAVHVLEGADVMVILTATIGFSATGQVAIARAQAPLNGAQGQREGTGAGTSGVPSPAPTQAQ